MRTFGHSILRRFNCHNLIGNPMAGDDSEVGFPNVNLDRKTNVSKAIVKSTFLFARSVYLAYDGSKEMKAA